MTCINTHDQLAAAGSGVAICPAYSGARDRNGWVVYRVVRGVRVLTDTRAHHGLMHFAEFGTSRAEALKEAKRWVAETYGERGPWVRNRLGDYLPERIHKAHPLRPLPRKKT